MLLQTIDEQFRCAHVRIAVGAQCQLINASKETLMLIELGRASVETKGQGVGTAQDPFLNQVKVKLTSVERNI